jgi:hypothetical protein
MVALRVVNAAHAPGRGAVALVPLLSLVAVVKASTEPLWDRGRRPLRTVDEKTAVMPLDEKVLGDHDALLDLLGAMCCRAGAAVPASVPAYGRRA